MNLLQMFMDKVIRLKLYTLLKVYWASRLQLEHVYTNPN